MACLIHHVAYVENLYPLEYSNFSTALISPTFPSCIKSRKGNPRFMYLLAILTTSLRLDSIRSLLASAAIFSPLRIFLSDLFKILSSSKCLLTSFFFLDFDGFLFCISSILFAVSIVFMPTEIILLI